MEMLQQLSCQPPAGPTFHEIHHATSHAIGEVALFICFAQETSSPSRNIRREVHAVKEIVSVSCFVDWLPSFFQHSKDCFPPGALDSGVDLIRPQYIDWTWHELFLRSFDKFIRFRVQCGEESSVCRPRLWFLYRWDDGCCESIFWCFVSDKSTVLFCLRALFTSEWYGFSFTC